MRKKFAGFRRGFLLPPALPRTECRFFRNAPGSEIWCAHVCPFLDVNTLTRAEASQICLRKKWSGGWRVLCDRDFTCIRLTPSILDAPEPPLVDGCAYFHYYRQLSERERAFKLGGDARWCRFRGMDEQFIGVYNEGRGRALSGYSYSQADLSKTGKEFHAVFRISPVCAAVRLSLLSQTTGRAWCGAKWEEDTASFRGKLPPLVIRVNGESQEWVGDGKIGLRCAAGSVTFYMESCQKKKVSGPWKLPDLGDTITPSLFFRAEGVFLFHQIFIGCLSVNDGASLWRRA